jgi:ribonuclease BN (tRNA processing enzyme)
MRAVEVARQAGAKHLVLFHHDPSHDDVELDRISLEASLLAEQVGVNDVISATEGLELSLGSGL